MQGDFDLIGVADRNFIGSYRKLVEHSPSGDFREFGSVTAFATRTPIGIFNGCIVPAPAGGDDVGAALDWIAGLDVPHRLWVHEELDDQVGAVALGRGMTQIAWLDPQMVLQPIPDLPPSGPGVTIREVSDRASTDEFRRLLVEGGLSTDDAARLFSDSFTADPDVRLVMAYLDDRPVGTSIAIRTGEVSGVYAVGTQPAARRRGVGTAATWAAVAAGRAWGCTAIVLQASEMGFPIYEAMGFRTVVRYRVYRPSA